MFVNCKYNSYFQFLLSFWNVSDMLPVLCFAKTTHRNEVGNRGGKDTNLPFFVLGPIKLQSVSWPKHAATNVRHSVGKCWSAGLRFSNVHWAEELECLFTEPLLRQSWIGTGAYINVAKAAISPPPSAISSTVRIMSSISNILRLFPGTKLREVIERELQNDESYSSPLTLDRINHFAQWLSLCKQIPCKQRWLDGYGTITNCINKLH